MASCFVPEAGHELSSRPGREEQRRPCSCAFCGRPSRALDGPACVEAWGIRTVATPPNWKTWDFSLTTVWRFTSRQCSMAALRSLFCRSHSTVPGRIPSPKFIGRRSFPSRCASGMRTSLATMLDVAHPRLWYRAIWRTTLNGAKENDKRLKFTRLGTSTELILLASDKPTCLYKLVPQ